MRTRRRTPTSFRSAPRRATTSCSPIPRCLAITARGTVELARQALGEDTTDYAVALNMLAYALRANAQLAPGGLWTNTLVLFLIDAGRRDEARAVAAGATDPATSRLLLAAADAQFGQALDVAAKALPRFGPADGGEAFELAYYASNVAVVLDRPPPDIDALVTRYLEPDPSPAGDPLTLYWATHACAVAPKPVARRCFARIRAIMDGPVMNVPGLVDGAERFAEGDHAGATLAWAPMLARPGWQLDFMRDLLAIAFEGNDDLVLRVDAPLLAKPGRYNGADLAYVRAARRAERRDPKAARM